MRFRFYATFVAALWLINILIPVVLSSQSKELSPFRKDNDYLFQYNAQISSGLTTQSEDDLSDPEQKSAIRLQAQAKITFNSDRHVQLQLKGIRFGQLNEQLEEPEKVQPMAIFEPVQIPAEKQSQLELPCQFSYADGVIEHVQFLPDDQTWSRNVKRAVLNMVQLNLKKNNAQGLRLADEQPGQDDEEEDGSQDGRNVATLGKSFNIPEITLEGACQTTYAINKAGKQRHYSDDVDEETNTNRAFNVTKTINFKQCSKIADVAYGFQTDQPQPECAECQMYWLKKQQQKNSQQQVTGEQQQPGEHHPCAKCDPKEVKEQLLDRSTVLRYQLQCVSDKCDGTSNYALKRTELLSQYVYKQAKAQNGKYSSAMHTVVAATLQFRSAGPKRGESAQNMEGSKGESLMYSNRVEADVKQFYMFGDEEFPEGSASPFHQVPKVQQAEQALRKLAQTLTGDQQKGIEVQAGIELQRLVELMRMGTAEELKKIEQSVAKLNSQEDKERAGHLYSDALAICGTRNCVQRMAEKIQNKQISQAKAVHAFKTLTQVPAPSDQIVKIVQRLCKQENVHEQRAVKQSCWLAFGALVHELCAHKTQKGAKQGPYGTQSGFEKQEQCPLDKKQEYKETILDLYKSAASIYDKVLALSTLGNAGIDIAVGDIEKIVKDQSEARLVRSMAIDSLRRLRAQMPHKIQQILLPIFQNGRENAEVRASALATLLSTQPEQVTIDQIVFQISRESNKQMQSFAYRQMKALVNSKNPVLREMAKHIKNALKLANVDEQQLHNSGKWQLPVYSDAQQEGFFVHFAQLISSRSAAPAYFHAQIDSLINDQYNVGQVKLFMAQQEAEDWYQPESSKFGGKTRADRRSSSSFDFNQSLHNLYAALGIKGRRTSSLNGDDNQNSQSNSDRRQPFVMLGLRIGAVDQGFVAIDGSGDQKQNEWQDIARQLLDSNNGVTTKFGILSHLFDKFQRQQVNNNDRQNQMRGIWATNLNEKHAKIPTSFGLPLRLLTSTPLIATIDGQIQVNMGSDLLESPLGAEIGVNVHATASLVYIQKMESALPFATFGVESVRSLEANVPLHFDLNANRAQGVSLKVKFPRQSTTLFGFHSLPFTYSAQVDDKTQLVHEPRHVRAIHQSKLERMQHDVSKNYQTAEQMGIPLHVQGHYHWPAQPTSYQQFFQMLVATENMLHATFQPNNETPREAIFRISGSQFQKASGHIPPLQNFYSQRIESAFGSEELDNIQTDDNNQRMNKLQNFLGNYQPSQQYKHSLKMSAQTIGGPKEMKAQSEVIAICDAKIQACNFQLEAQRSALGIENQKWTLKAQVDVIMPETAQTVDELESQRNNKLQGKMQAEWGTEKKQNIAIRVHGEQARTKQRTVRNNGQDGNGRWRREAFLNKFDIEARYDLKPETQNVFRRSLELLKSAYYWNSQSKLLLQPNNGNSQTNGQVLVSIVIDPISQKHANATIKMPSQQVRFQQIELPIRARPFALVRSQSQSTHSIDQLISQLQVQGRAGCFSDGRSINTFDNHDYNSPLSASCYSVLAKDCSSDQPRFVVLMKAKGDENVGKPNGPKKLKVITPTKEIECQPVTSSGRQQQQIICKQNGSPVQNNADTDAIEFNNAQGNDVTVNVPGISVRFNGRKAWLKVSSLYKNAQCGLCGHYDDSEQDEWRMGNNHNTDDLAQFHRSYTVSGGQQDEECTDQNRESFYQKYANDIRRYGDENQENDGVNDNQEEQWARENFDGQWQNSNSYDVELSNGKERGSGNVKQGNGNNKQDPVEKTKILEMNHQICFSQDPVKECPKGTSPIFSNNDQKWEDARDADEKNVRFTCMSRTSPETRRILRQVRRNGGNAPVPQSEDANSIVETIREPKKCMRNDY